MRFLSEKCQRNSEVHNGLDCHRARSSNSLSALFCPRISTFLRIGLVLTSLSIPLLSCQAEKKNAALKDGAPIASMVTAAQEQAEKMGISSDQSTKTRIAIHFLYGEAREMLTSGTERNSSEALGKLTELKNTALANVSNDPTAFENFASGVKALLGDSSESTPNLSIPRQEEKQAEKSAESPLPEHPSQIPSDPEIEALKTLAEANAYALAHDPTLEVDPDGTTLSVERFFLKKGYVLSIEFGCRLLEKINAEERLSPSAVSGVSRLYPHGASVNENLPPVFHTSCTSKNTDAYYLNGISAIFTNEGKLSKSCGNDPVHASLCRQAVLLHEFGHYKFDGAFGFQSILGHHMKIKDISTELLNALQVEPDRVNLSDASIGEFLADVAMSQSADFNFMYLEANAKFYVFSKSEPHYIFQLVFHEKVAEILAQKEIDPESKLRNYLNEDVTAMFTSAEIQEIRDFLLERGKAVLRVLKSPSAFE